MRALIISPHLDDAVLSCGQLMAGRRGVTVATVFAGVPADPAMSTTFDRDSGFQNAAEAVAARRVEDVAALDVLGARPEHLNFSDGQYEQYASEDAITKALGRLAGKVNPSMIVGPVGLAHPDHHTVRRCFQRLIRHDVEAWAYEDMPSRVLYPEEVPDALNWWRGMGHKPELGFIGTGPPDLKERAVDAYRSQEWALRRHLHCYMAPERFWRMW